MNKKFNSSLIIKIGVTLGAVVFSVACLVNSNDSAFSDDYGMGVPSDEAEYLNSFIGTDITGEEYMRLASEYEREHGYGNYSEGHLFHDEYLESQGLKEEKSSSTTNTANTQKQSPEQSSQSTPKAKATPAPAKTYEHNFGTINDEAKEAFVAFTSDGKPNSCYININAASTDNVITGKELNKTRTGKEDGRISFVDGDEVKYEWLFSNWESADDFTLDLTTHFIKIENGRYELAFSGGDIGNNNVVFRLRTGTPSMELFVYDGKSDKQGIITDNNGFLTINLRTLGNYIVSTSAALSNDEVTDSINSAETSGDDLFESTEIPFSTLEDVEDVPDDNMVTHDAETTEKPAIAAEQDEEDIFIDPGYVRKTQDKEDISKAESVDTVNKTESQSELVSDAVANNVLVIDDGPSLPNPLFIFIGLGVIVLVVGSIVIYRYKR